MTGTTRTTETTDVRRAAMDLLARREHSVVELSTKLLKRFPGQHDLVGEQVERLRQEGLQSDRRMAEAFIRSRTQRGQGPLKIHSELRGRGVADATIAVALIESDTDWATLAAELYERKYGTAVPDNPRELARRSRFLQQRGFTFDQISPLLKL